MQPKLSAPALLFYLPIVLTLLVFWPGISGPFLIDDPGAISKLAGADGATDTLEEVTHLMFPQHVGTGRSLSYLSLLLNDNAWPTEPRSFKYTNLLLHCLNGVLVFVLARLLARTVRDAGSPGGAYPAPDWVALLAMTLWLVHPIHLSPIMIVIQRMTLLAGTFSLLALIAYVHGRRVAVANARRGYVWMVPVFGFCLVLGLMSKDTAAMTIGFVIALEATVLGPATLPRPNGWRTWAGVFLALPLCLVALYLISINQVLTEAYGNRHFSLSERLMTEGRVLMQYLRVILFPSLSQTGPFQDDFVVSRGLLDPPTTLVALLTIVGLMGLAWWGRQRWPIFALAVLWFFFGHILEGTVLPLELYFEHRNYLPMFGICFAASYGLVALDKGTRRLAWGGLALFIVLASGISYLSAGVWGRADLIAGVWGAEHPTSPRAQALTLRYWAEQGDTERLFNHVNRVIAVAPNYAGYRLYRLIIDRCSDEQNPKIGGSMEDLEQIIPSVSYDVMSMELLKWLTAAEATASCRVSAAEMVRIFELYLSNPRFIQNREVHHQLYILYAGYQRSRGDLASWSESLDRAFALVPVYGLALRMAYFYIEAGDFERAEIYLDKAATAPRMSLYDWLWQDQQVRHVRTLLVRERQTALNAARDGMAHETTDTPAPSVGGSGQPAGPTGAGRDDR